MKDQYFGDVNDYRKYGLLRALTGDGGMRVGVVWMLTPSDGRSDGRFLGYLDKPREFRGFDSELFDWLKQVVGVEGDRRVARIEASGLLAGAEFVSELVPDAGDARREWFDQAAGGVQGADLVFFDPDNGIEVKSKRYGCKDSCKFVYWDEVFRTFEAGASVLVYQHFTREKREGFVARLKGELAERTGAAEVLGFRTAHVVFLLAVQGRDLARLRQGAEWVAANWMSQIAVV